MRVYDLNIDQLKHKLRELKKIEKTMREQHFLSIDDKDLVWNSFFSTKNKDSSNIKYPINILAVFGHNARREVFNEFFYQMYYEIISLIGFQICNLYDPQLLALLDLGPEASKEDIRSQFRKLAKKYHPDHGGDKEKMIELIEVYDKLLNKTDK